MGRIRLPEFGDLHRLLWQHLGAEIPLRLDLVWRIEQYLDLVIFAGLRCLWFQRDHGVSQQLVPAEFHGARLCAILVGWRGLGAAIRELMGNKNTSPKGFGRGPLLIALVGVSFIANGVLAVLTQTSRQEPDPLPRPKIDPQAYKIRGEAREAKLDAMQASHQDRGSTASGLPGTSDLPGLVSDLAAKGYAPRVIRATVVRLLHEEYELQLRARLADEKTFQEWKVKGMTALTPQQREEAKALARETEQRARAMFTPLPILDDPASRLRWERQLGATIPWPRYLELARIEMDYGDMHRAIELAPGEDPTRRSQHELLDAERRKDMEALLSPEELAEYELRFSPTAAVVRGRIGKREVTEREFRELFQAQRELDERMRKGEARP